MISSRPDAQDTWLPSLGAPPPFRVRIATAAASLAVLALLAVYLLFPTEMALAVSIDRSGLRPALARSEVIYGSVYGLRGGPVAGVTVSLEQREDRKWTTVLSVTSQSDGTFRQVARLPEGEYLVVVSDGDRHSRLAATRAIQLAPGYAYRITVRLVRTGIILLFPVRAY